jgi:hypothetical protein
MSIQKRYLKSKPICKTTFRLKPEEGVSFDDTAIAGTFNDWTPEPMKGLKDGSFKIEFDLEQGKTYEFRYVIGAEKWVNDEEADAYVPNNIDGENSVVHC